MRSPLLLGTLFFALSSGACTVLGTSPQPDSGSPGDGGPGTDGGGNGLLAVDCRNLSNLHDVHCASPTQYDSSTTIGSGPHFVDTLDVVHRGFTDANRIIASLGTANGGVVLAVDVTTGNRTVISGPSVGTGTALPNVFDVQPGPDGWYALANGSVWRIAPATGNRTMVWDTTMGDAQCTFLAAASIAYNTPLGGIAVGPDGSIYLAITTTQGNNLGSGLIAVHAGTCKLLSHTGYPTSVNHGTGPDILGGTSQFALQNGKLMVQDSNVIGSVDLTTGNRTVISSNTVGSGPMLGGDTMAISIDGKSAWTACNTDGTGTYVNADLASGARTGKDPYDGTPLSIGGPWCLIWTHPTLPLLVVEDANGFSLFEPSTGNSNVLSY